MSIENWSVGGDQKQRDGGQKESAPKEKQKHQQNVGEQAESGNNQGTSLKK